jgi:hypothetical protein
MNLDAILGEWKLVGTSQNGKNILGTERNGKDYQKAIKTLIKHSKIVEDSIPNNLGSSLVSNLMQKKYFIELGSYTFDLGNSYWKDGKVKVEGNGFSKVYRGNPNPRSDLNVWKSYEPSDFLRFCRDIRDDLLEYEAKKAA